MAQAHSGANLVPLSESDKVVADPDLDVRGRDVVTRDEETIGVVDELLIDDEELRVRFMRVGSGGFLGIGKDHVLVPVDVISRIEPERVRINRDRAGLADVPVYDPDLARQPEYYPTLYGWWGATPYWGAGYTYPHWP